MNTSAIGMNTLVPILLNFFLGHFSQFSLLLGRHFSFQLLTRFFFWSSFLIFQFLFFFFSSVLISPCILWALVSSDFSVSQIVILLYLHANNFHPSTPPTVYVTYHVPADFRWVSGYTLGRLPMYCRNISAKRFIYST